MTLMKKENYKIIAIIPAYNESGKISKVVKKIPTQYVDEILVVDDGSIDDTRKEAEQAGASVISHPKNRGVGAAIRTGLDYALQKGFDIAVIMGGDDQDDPTQMDRLLKKIIDEGYDFVQGSRYLPEGETVNIPWFRWITTGFYSFLFKVLAQFPITDGTNGFRAFRLSILKHPQINIHQRWLNTYELEPYLYYKAIKCGFKVTEAPVTKSYPKGKRGFSKMIPLLDWWRILKPLIYLKLKLKN